MTVRAPFKPHFGSGQTVTAAAASATITIGAGDKSIRVVNLDAANVAQVRTGEARNGAVVATAADLAIAPGEAIVFEKPQDDDTLAYISASGASLHIMSGEGGV